MKDTVGGKCVAEQAKEMLDSMIKWRYNIEEAMGHAEWSHTFDDLTMMTLRGDLTFFDFGDCYCFTQISQFPQFKVFHFLTAGGNIDSIIEKTDYFKELAKAHGCKQLSFSGRKGFEPVLKREGWKHKFTTMWLEV